MEKFKTIEQHITGELIEKKSKFIANIFSVKTVEEAEEIIKKLKKKYYDARHNCYAYITFDTKKDIIEKCSDDGEPSGTAGAPILAILKGKELCNILVVVTRYFGGILLGTGGLVRAYSDVVTKTLENANVIIKEKGRNLKVILTYQDAEKLKYYCRKNNIEIAKEEYSENVEFLIKITNVKLKNLEREIDNLTIKVIKKEKMEENYI